MFEVVLRAEKRETIRTYINGASGSEINSVDGRISSLSFADDPPFDDHRSSFSDCSRLSTRDIFVIDHSYLSLS